MSNRFQKKNVYVVDDTSFMRANVVKALVDFGFSKERIHQFENARVAFEALGESNIECHLILSDWNMPQMTGLEFLKNVRASNGYFKHVPFVMITTESEKSKVIEALQFQLSGYILKPLESEKLKEVLDNIFSPEE